MELKNWTRKLVDERFPKLAMALYYSRIGPVIGEAKSLPPMQRNIKRILGLPQPGIGRARSSPVTKDNLLKFIQKRQSLAFVQNVRSVPGCGIMWFKDPNNDKNIFLIRKGSPLKLAYTLSSHSENNQLKAHHVGRPNNDFMIIPFPIYYDSPNYYPGDMGGGSMDNFTSSQAICTGPFHSSLSNRDWHSLEDISIKTQNTHIKSFLHSTNHNHIAQSYRYNPSSVSPSSSKDPVVHRHQRTIFQNSVARKVATSSLNFSGSGRTFRSCKGLPRLGATTDKLAGLGRTASDSHHDARAFYLRSKKNSDDVNVLKNINTNNNANTSNTGNNNTNTNNGNNRLFFFNRKSCNSNNGNCDWKKNVKTYFNYHFPKSIWGKNKSYFTRYCNSYCSSNKSVQKFVCRKELYKTFNKLFVGSRINELYSKLNFNLKYFYSLKTFTVLSWKLSMILNRLAFSGVSSYLIKRLGFVNINNFNNSRLYSNILDSHLRNIFGSGRESLSYGYVNCYNQTAFNVCDHKNKNKDDFQKLQIRSTSNIAHFNSCLANDQLLNNQLKYINNSLNGDNNKKKKNDQNDVIEVNFQALYSYSINVINMFLLLNSYGILKLPDTIKYYYGKDISLNSPTFSDITLNPRKTVHQMVTTSVNKFNYFLNAAIFKINRLIMNDIFTAELSRRAIMTKVGYIHFKKIHQMNQLYNINPYDHYDKVSLSLIGKREFSSSSNLKYFKGGNFGTFDNSDFDFNSSCQFNNLNGGFECGPSPNQFNIGNNNNCNSGNCNGGANSSGSYNINPDCSNCLIYPVSCDVNSYNDDKEDNEKHIMDTINNINYDISSLKIISIKEKEGCVLQKNISSVKACFEEFICIVIEKRQQYKSENSGNLIRKDLISNTYMDNDKSIIYQYKKVEQYGYYSNRNQYLHLLICDKVDDTDKDSFFMKLINKVVEKRKTLTLFAVLIGIRFYFKDFKFCGYAFWLNSSIRFLYYLLRNIKFNGVTITRWQILKSYIKSSLTVVSGNMQDKYEKAKKTQSLLKFNSSINDNDKMQIDYNRYNEIEFSKETISKDNFFSNKELPRSFLFVKYIYLFIDKLVDWLPFLDKHPFTKRYRLSPKMINFVNSYINYTSSIFNLNSKNNGGAFDNKYNNYHNSESRNHFNHDETISRIINYNKERFGNGIDYEYVELVRRWRDKMLPSDDQRYKLIASIVNRLLSVQYLDSIDLEKDNEFSSIFKKSKLKSVLPNQMGLNSTNIKNIKDVEGRLHSLFEGIKSTDDNNTEQSIIDWQLHVIDEDSITNAFVTDTGKIFVFTGLIKLCSQSIEYYKKNPLKEFKNPKCQLLGDIKLSDMLGAVIAHELAHVLSYHAQERYILWSFLTTSSQLLIKLLKTTMTGMIFTLGGLSIVSVINLIEKFNIKMPKMYSISLSTIIFGYLSSYFGLSKNILFLPDQPNHRYNHQTYTENKGHNDDSGNNNMNHICNHKDLSYGFGRCEENYRVNDDYYVSNINNFNDQIIYDKVFQPILKSVKSLFNSLMKICEWEADIIGVYLMAKAKLDPRAARMLWMYLSNISNDDTNQQVKELSISNNEKLNLTYLINNKNNNVEIKQQTMYKQEQTYNMNRKMFRSIKELVIKGPSDKNPKWRINKIHTNVDFNEQNCNYRLKAFVRQFQTNDINDYINDIAINEDHPSHKMRAKVVINHEPLAMFIYVQTSF